MPFNQAIPLSLYIHTPWCVHKCPYCDFNSHSLTDELPAREYVEALWRDLETDLDLIWGRRINSIFIGGGTPSLFPPQAIATLLDGIRSRITVLPTAEITLEANPGTVDLSRFLGFHDAGINRLSIGIQSFDDNNLKNLQRIHNGADACRAVEAAFAAGFDNINLDLMFGLPGQSIANALADLKRACDFQVPHLSWYQLTIEPNTLFHHRPPPNLPEDDNLWEMQQQGQNLLSSKAWEQYEISAYARDAKRCRHNLNYWQFGDYLGIGAGAHSKLTDAGSKQIIRYSRTRHPQAWFKAVQSGNKEMLRSAERVEPERLSLEFMLNALRLHQGFETALFNNRTGLDWESMEKPLREAEKNAWISRRAGSVRPTALGLQFLNELLLLF